MMSRDERSSLLRLRDNLHLQVVNIDALLEADATRATNAAQYRGSVRAIKDARAEREWRGIKFGRDGKAARVWDDDGA